MSAVVDVDVDVCRYGENATNDGGSVLSRIPSMDSGDGDGDASAGGGGSAGVRA